MEEAYYCYARWGAKAKTDDLEKRYPQLLKPYLQQRRLNLNPLETIGTIARSSISTSTCSSAESIDLDYTLEDLPKMVDAIVEDKHEGKLSCNSALGEGTEFMIMLPQ